MSILKVCVNKFDTLAIIDFEQFTFNHWLLQGQAKEADQLQACSEILL